MKRKLTAAQKKAKSEQQKKYEWVFMNGKQVRIRRPEMIDGMLVDDWIENNADDVWLTQNRMYDVIDARQREADGKVSAPNDVVDCDDSDLPF